MIKDELVELGFYIFIAICMMCINVVFILGTYAMVREVFF